MQRSSTRLASGLILVWGLGLAVSGCDTGIRASQATMSSGVKPVPVEPVLLESDTMVTDCDQLAKVSMAAELNAMGLQRSLQALPPNSTSLAKNVQDLQQSVAQLQELSLQNNQVIQLRNQYVTLLQSLSQTEPSSAAVATVQAATVQAATVQAATVQAAVKLRRDKIFFNSCKS
jgi:TolA-binding protein